tara:strand:+ start:980 stop:1318 length:339 start_codon:yes stop_codon:yes gene_type:complete
MSDSGILQQFNINELAGATGLILGALGGILAIIFKSRCYCRLNLCYLCYCERKPPPEPEVNNDSSDEEKLVPDKKDKKDKVDRGSKEIEKPEPLKGNKEKEREPEPEPELIP